MIMEARKLYPLTLAFLLVLTMFLIVESLAWIYRGSFQQIDDIQQHGFEPVECWFGDATSSVSYTHLTLPTTPYV